MESTTSKTTANILIVLAIVLIGGSIATTLNKKEEPLPVATNTPVVTKNETQAPLVQENTPTYASNTPSVSLPVNMLSADFISNILSKKWTWEKNIATDGTVTVTPKKIDAFSFTLKEDSSLSGTTDCNSFFGSFTTNADNLSFGQLGSTMMYCEDAQESTFMQALQNVTKYTFSTTTKSLILMTASGTMYFK